MLKNFKIRLTQILGLFILSSCDPGHGGNIYINNRSSDQLLLNYVANSDSGSLIIYPNTRVDIHKFGGLGEGNSIYCCPCLLLSVQLMPVDTSKQLTKSIDDSTNWIMINPNIKKFDSEHISCDFIVTSADIQ